MTVHPKNVNNEKDVAKDGGDPKMMTKTLETTTKIGNHTFSSHRNAKHNMEKDVHGVWMIITR